MTGPLVTVIGEALVDLVPEAGVGDYKAHPGGSPFNVAIALARLRNRAALMARLGDHGFGRLLRDVAASEGVELGAAAHASEPATLAVVALDGPGSASYEFYVQGTADWQWTMPELRRRPVETTVLHFGSIASWTEPGSERIDELICAVRADDDVLVSYDPNVRPTLLTDRVRGRTVVERSIGRAHVVKASREDIEWLYPARSLDEIGAGWNELGAALVVVTDGADGALAYRAGARALVRPGRPVHVVDTIGAGDSFSAALLGGLIRRGLHTPGAVATIPDDALAGVLDEAVLVSSITCERPGANPPRLSADVGPRALTAEDFVTE